MLDFGLAIVMIGYLAIGYIAASAFLTSNPRPVPGRDTVLLILVICFANAPLIFVVERNSGTAVLSEGMTASNLVSIAIAAMTGLYLLGRVAYRSEILLVPFSEPYLPFTLMILVNLVSAAWSIVPLYTLYRGTELVVFYLAVILLFEQAGSNQRMARLLAIFIGCWLISTWIGGFTGAVRPSLFENLGAGVVFSAAKNNLMPLVCAALAFIVIFDASIRRRGALLIFAAIGFVLAGSAASTAALIGCAPAILLASSRKLVRLSGAVLLAATVAGFIVMMLGIAQFPLLLEAVAFVLQKPPSELANATGRAAFWPTFLAATDGKIFGSGFSAADRFIQLLIPTETLARELGSKDLRIASAHNMFLSAWAGTGVIGLGFAALVILNSIRYSFFTAYKSRCIAICVIAMLVLNGMTTPGIFFDWNVNVLAFVAILAMMRRETQLTSLQDVAAQALRTVGSVAARSS